jgi:hypothetical protein
MSSLSLSTGSWTNQEILGTGARGIVITKPFECEHSFNKTRNSKSWSPENKSNRSRRSMSSSRRSLNTKDTIIKISIGDAAVREYNFMKRLPQGKRYPYAQIKQIRLCKVKPGPKMIKRLRDLEKIHHEINVQDFIEHQDNLWQLFMPRFGNKTLYSILGKKQVPTNRILYYDTNKSMDNNKFLTVKQLKNILHHFSVLLTLFIELNGKSFYHKDLKSNNIMCDVDKKGYISKMWVIDFDLAIDWNQRDKKSRNDWEYTLKHTDIRMLMSKLVREVLLVACSNKPLYDELLPYIQKIDFFMIESERNINQDAIDLLDEIKAKVDTLKEPAWNEYVNVVVVPPNIPAKVQRMKAVGHYENSDMGKEDTWTRI